MVGLILYIIAWVGTKYTFPRCLVAVLINNLPEGICSSSQVKGDRPAAEQEN